MDRCGLEQHLLYDYQQVFNEQMILLEGKVNLCCPKWERAIADRGKVQEHYKHVLESLIILQSKVTKEMEINDGNIAMLMTLQQEFSDLPIIPSDRNSTDEEYMATVDQMKDFSDRYFAIKI